MHLKPGTLLKGGTYRIERFINSGGFGCTYEAVHTMLDERVAIKEFFVKDFCNRDEDTYHVTVGTHSKKALVEKLKKKFIEEAKSIRKLHHNGIVKVSDVFEENGTAYYVMDYIEGQTLGQLIDKKGRLSETETLRYISQVSETLKYVHSKKMLHLDIKPGNIMIDKDDNAILIDFGTSKQYDEVEGENTSTLLGKTPGYAPLEQMDNSVQEFYPATDIYALGATMYKMLSGITPPNAIARAAGSKMEMLPAKISEKTKTAVYASMQILKEKRPQSIEELLKALDAKAEEDKKKAEDEGTNPTPKPKNWILYVVLAVVLGIGLYFVSDNIKKNKAAEEENKANAFYTRTHGSENGHDWVDLGLPSGIKWATCNVGANKPKEYGNYFAWGEIDAKSSYTESNSKTYGRQYNSCSRANRNRMDAARANWDGLWRMPTGAELQELLDECTWIWMSKYAKGDGFKVQGPNGNSIFIPAAGLYDGDELKGFREAVCYWSSSSDYGSNRSASCLHSSCNYWRVTDDTVSLLRYYGMSIRPVLDN